MRKWLKPLAFVPILFVSLTLPGQSDEMLKQFFNVDQGLSHDEVTAIVQDSDGFIWIGTRGGLNRFDGYEFKVFNQVAGDSNSLVNPSIETLFINSKKNIWIGTKSGGLSKYNPETPAELKNIAELMPEKMRELAKIYFDDSIDFPPPKIWGKEKREELVQNRINNFYVYF